MATEKAYPSFENFPTIGRPNITYVAQDTGYKYIFNQGYRLVSGSAQQINNKRPNPSGTTDLTASDVGALPNTATVTINGTTKQLSTNPIFTIASDVTSVDGRTGDVYTANGIISPEAAVLSINVDNTKFDVAAGTGVIEDAFFSWDEQLGITPIYLATSTLTHVYVAADGTIFQSDIEPTPQLRRQYLYLGQLGHTNFTTIQTAVNMPEVFAQTDQQFRDLLACFGILNCNGNIVSANGANLKINVSAGDLYGSGINWETDGADNPNDRHFVSVTAPFFRRRTQTGNGVVADTIDVANYDNAGTITAIVGTKYQNQRVYRLISGNIVVQYGQVLYNSLAAAIEGLNNEAYIEFPNVTKIGALIGFISVGSNCTSLQDTSRARIYTTSKIGGASVPPNIDGSGTANEITYWIDADTLGSLTTATYPSLTELARVKGVTSGIQTQLDTKQPINFPSQYSLVFDDFTGLPSLTATFTGLSNYAYFSANNGTISTTSTKYTRAVGVYSLATGTGTTGTSLLLGRYIFLGEGTIAIQSRNALVSLSTLANRFFYRHGLMNSVTEAGTTDGIYFRCIDNENSGNFVCVCRAASVESVVNTAVAPTTVTLQNLRIEVNAAGTSAQFFIDGISVATIATNIPANTVLLSHILAIQKTTGNTDRQLHTDYMYQLVTFTTAR